MANFFELSIFDKTATIALYLTVAVLLIVGATYFAVKKLRPENTRTAKLISGGLLIGYALGILIPLFYLKFDEYLSNDYIDFAVYYPVVALLGLAALIALGAFFVSVFAKRRIKLYGKISLAVISAAALALFISATVKNLTSGAVDANKELSLYGLILAIVLALAFPALFVGKKTTSENHTKSIVYAAVCIATSFALSYIRFFELPLGGSITFASLVPIMFYSYMFGTRKGVLVGLVYGLLQFIQAPWFVHPAQFLLDYPLAFAAIGLTGIFKEAGLFKKTPVPQFALGAVLAVTLRYFSHVISGIFIWGSGDPENYGAVAWSFLYNSFAFADMAIAMFVGCIMFTSRAFVRQLDINSNASAVQSEKAAVSAIQTENASSEKIEETVTDKVEKPKFRQ